MLPLEYLDLYRLCEELRQLVGGQVQGVSNPSPLRYILEIRLPMQSRNLIIDLTPSKPFIVSTSFTKTKSQSKKTPATNFLKAHFQGSRIEKLEVASKPNRIVKILFTGAGELIVKCFPHGQHLVLKADKKVVNIPLRPKNNDIDEASYVEPEASKTWDFNDELFSEIFNVNGGTLKNPEGLEKSAEDSYRLKVLKKLERAVQTLEKGIAEQRPLDLERIEALRVEASLRQGRGTQELFDEIKRINKKAVVSEQRRQDLLSQIAKIQSNPGALVQPKISPSKVKKGESRFSGTRVRISEHWELWVGRNAWQNDDLLKVGGSHELWFHLRDYPGAHGLLRGPKKSEPTPSQVELAARIVAILSQSKKRPFSEGENLDFIITPKKFVRKRKGDAPGRVTVERESVRRIAFKSLKFEVI